VVCLTILRLHYKNPLIVTIDPITSEDKENNGKTTKIWRLKGIPDNSDSLIFKFGDKNPESITINIK